MVARRYVLIDYDLPARAARRRPSRLAPGIESPTVSPLHDPDWVGRARDGARASDMNHVMDALYALGARAILVTPIHAARIC